MNRQCQQCHRRMSPDQFDGPWRICFDCIATNRRVAEMARIDRQRKKSSGFVALGHDGRVCILNAAKEGRLDSSWAKDLGLKTGQAICGICGMRHWTEQEAYLCCDVLRKIERLDPALYKEDRFGLKASLWDELDGLPIMFDLFGDRINTGAPR